ncbi:MAG: Stp1/IreP family PP2C-type Ser/Thr phosphatase [Thermoanaerobaculia bacterium]|nr:Stp1/IreP family PP2C-type Ser/Thr phosphatase [Thermoanaerobaculia bacterium]
MGVLRSHNEDCFEIDPVHQLFVVADGMGGHSHGEIASRIAVQAIRECIATDGDGSEEAPGAGPEGVGRQGDRIRKAIRVAHDRVLKAIRQDGSLHGMGTTVVGMVLESDTMAVAHVGDSRAYRLRNGKFELLTQDHTWVNEQVVAGFLTEEQARVHPLKNVVTRALGGDSEVEVDVREWPVQVGDLFLLCSDGLTTMLSDPEILERLRPGARMEEICSRLVRDANARGGFDNISVVLLRIEADRDAFNDEETAAGVD